MPVRKGTKFTKEHKRKIALAKIGNKNPNWKGKNALAQSGRYRGIRMYPLEPCEICGSEKAERHHNDGNTLNNNRKNIRFLCRKHHMETDGRKTGIDLGGTHPGELNHNSKLTEKEVLEIRATTDIGPYKLSRKYGVSYRTIWAIKNRRAWKHL